MAGIVTHRQRPATAGGTTFLNLEDETGLINVICSRGVWARYRSAAQGAAALLIRGRLEKTVTGAQPVRCRRWPSGDGQHPHGPGPGTAGGTVVINLVADRIDPLPMTVRPRPSRDFR